jgi:hypothetical protein
MEPRTTIDYKGHTYPFYKTNRGRVDFENAGFTTEDVIQGKTTATLAMIYYHLVDCAKRNNTPIQDSFEQFIDNSDPDIEDVFLRLAEKRQEAEGSSEKAEESKNLQALAAGQ